MRLRGRINHQDCVVLIDSRSTHNFLDPEILKGSKLKADSNHKLAVTIANGEKVKSEGKCADVMIRMQGNEFEMEAYVLMLGGCDVVLGV